MFSLLWGLLFRPQQTMAAILSSPNTRQASRISLLIVMLNMMTFVFLVPSTPYLNQLGMFKWVLAFFLPPLQFWLQRFFFVPSARLGLMMFAGNRLPRDPFEKRAKLGLVHLAFPYVMYPLVFFNIISSAFDSAIVLILAIVGYVYVFVLMTVAIRTIYGVSSAVAFWGPMLAQTLIVIVLSMVFGAILLVVALMTNMSFAP